MNTRKDRLNEVYEYLRNHFGIHTKTQFAAVLKITQPALSSAMNGNEAYLTDNLFKRICAEYQGVFDLTYLLTGEGELITGEENYLNEKYARYGMADDLGKKMVDQGSLLNALIAAKDESIESLKRELKSKDELIRVLQSQIKYMERKIKIYDVDVNLSDFPFEQGVADAG